MTEQVKEPQDYGHPTPLSDQPSIDTVDVGLPKNTPPADDDVQSDPALTVYPGADWADEGGAPAPVHP